MGTFFPAGCPCGYGTLALLGGGMDNFDREFPAPFHCPSCRALVNADLLAQAPACPECGDQTIVPYTHPAMAGEPGTRVHACNYFSEDGGGTVSLTDCTYLCPACGKKSLRFGSPGCYD